MRKLPKDFISKGWCRHMVLSVNNERGALEADFDSVASKQQSVQKRKQRKEEEKQKTLKRKSQRAEGRWRW